MSTSKFQFSFNVHLIVNSSLGLIMAVEKALKKDYRFTTTLAIDNLHTLNPFIGAYFLQHHLGEDAASLKVLRQCN